MTGESAAGDDIISSPHTATGLDESNSEPGSADQSEEAVVDGVRRRVIKAQRER